MKRCVFTINLNLDYVYDDTHLNAKSQRFCSKAMSIYTLYFSEISHMQKQYADFCNADYLICNGADFKDFEIKYHKMYPIASPYDVAQYFKIHMCEHLSAHYDEILYLDFDVLIGKVKQNFFTSWNLENGIVIKDQRFNVSNFQYKSSSQTSSREIKAYLAHEVLQRMGELSYDPKHVPHMNTGLIGCTEKSIKSVNFFEYLPSLHRHLSDMWKNKEQNWEQVRNSNEIVFTIAYLLEQFNLQSIVGDYNIWHKKANGVDDMNSVLLHCTGKDWISIYMDQYEYDTI